MARKLNHLSLTNLLEGWCFDSQNIFLWNGWLTHKNTPHLSAIRYIIAEPYGISKEHKDTDLIVTNKIKANLLTELAQLLNEHHTERHSERYWNVLLGHWLTRFVRFSYNKINSLTLIDQKYHVNSTTLINADETDFIPIDTAEFLKNLESSTWNYFFLSKILLGLKDFGYFNNLKVKSSSKIKRKVIEHFSIKKFISVVFYKLFAKISQLLTKNCNAMITNTYLNKSVERKLAFALKQLPTLWPRLPIKKADRYLFLRSELSLKLESKFKTTEEKLIARLLVLQLPVCFLESYKSSVLVAIKLRPKDPKFIFTSNSFDTDEIFKFWLANKIEKGTKYFVGQHGNNYGTYRYDMPTIEEQTSDVFFTWGWTHLSNKYIRAFNFKSANKDRYKKREFSTKVTLMPPPRFAIHETWDADYEYIKNIHEQFDFVANLDQANKSNLQIKLHSSHYGDKWRTESKWRDEFNEIKILEAGYDFEDVISSSKILVYAYDSTGILECLSRNVPFIAFWPGEFQHLDSSAINFYVKLAAVGILHPNGTSAAAFLNKISTNVLGWWSSYEVVNARDLFCNNYSRSVNNPVQFLVDHLTD